MFVSGLHHTPQHTISSDKTNRGISQTFVGGDGTTEQEDRMLCWRQQEDAWGLCNNEDTAGKKRWSVSWAQDQPTNGVHGWNRVMIRLAMVEM